MKSAPSDKLHSLRSRISEQVRHLRRDRQWTQAELARHLELSQSRLSEIESGRGSFSAEQFLTLLKLFNVPVTHFAGKSRDRAAETQNALARLGAGHLQESAAVLPAEELDDVASAIRGALIEGAPRLVASLPLVLVRNLDRINLKRVQLDLVEAGAPSRLPWLVEATLDAIGHYLTTESVPTPWARRLRRAEVVLAPFLDAFRETRPDSPIRDVLDPNIRSRRTADEVEAASSVHAKRWGVVTRLGREDFVQALRATAHDEY